MAEIKKITIVNKNSMDLNDGDSSEEDEDIKVNIPTFLDKSSVNVLFHQDYRIVIIVHRCRSALLQ